MTHRWLPLGALAFLLCGCGPYPFSTVVRQVASQQPGYCGGEITVTTLNDWAFRVEACERTTFYHCSYKRRSMGRTVCCTPMLDEDAAKAFVSFDRAGEKECKDLAAQ